VVIVASDARLFARMCCVDMNPSSPDHRSGYPFPVAATCAACQPSGAAALCGKPCYFPFVVDNQCPPRQAGPSAIGRGSQDGGGSRLGRLCTNAMRREGKGILHIRKSGPAQRTPFLACMELRVCGTETTAHSIREMRLRRSSSRVEASVCCKRAVIVVFDWSPLIAVITSSPSSRRQRKKGLVRGITKSGASAVWSIVRPNAKNDEGYHVKEEPSMYAVKPRVGGKKIR